VIIPTYKHEKFVAQALESVLAQTHRPLEILVIDDGSPDGTAQVLAPYAEQHTGWLRVVRKRNGGVAMARNTGAALARGELLAFLDSDDEWLPRKLELQVAEWKARRDAGTEVGLVLCGVAEVDGQGREMARNIEGLEGNVAHEFLLWDYPYAIGGGSAALVPRHVCIEVGGYDPSLPAAEDWDFYYRVAARYPLAFVPQVLLKYRQHTNVDGRRHANFAAVDRAMTIFYAKAFGHPTPAMQKIRRRSYSNLHMNLAGSYWKAGQKAPFLRHLVRAVVLRPAHLRRLLPNRPRGL
jgi:glycosyltransferase involved in cell wall biosynthesis